MNWFTFLQGVCVGALIVLLLPHLSKVLDGGGVVEMRANSARIMDGFWRSGVSYDTQGFPWGRAHDGKRLRLYPDGSTTDTHLYGTKWTHVDGEPISFPPDS